MLLEQANLGICSAIYNSLLIASGEYICLVDADDELAPEYLSIMGGILDNDKGLDYVRCDFMTYITDRETKIYHTFTPHYSLERLNNPSQALKNFFCGGIETNVWTVLARRNTISVDAFLTDDYTATQEMA